LSGERGTTTQRFGRAAALVLLAIAWGRVLSYSWVTDDGFITFRVVLNFVAGRGPVFNVGERVQAFTHPFWFFLLSVGGALNQNLYFWAILLGLALTGGCLGILLRLRAAHESPWGAIGIAALALFFSEPFLTFSTSGLENSLTHLLLLGLIWASVDLTAGGQYRALLVSAVFGLALLTRLDNLFMTTAFWAYGLWTSPGSWRKRLGQAAVGLTPLVTWHLFSVVYYGFALPNTRAAKLARVAGVPAFDDHVWRGLEYLAVSIQGDLLAWLGATAILCGAIVWRRRAPATIWLALFAVASQVFYVVVVMGGDFMRGRFFSWLPLAVAACVLVAPWLRSERPSWLAAALVAVVGWWSHDIALSERFWFNSGIAENERRAHGPLIMSREPYELYFTAPGAKDAQAFQASLPPEGPRVALVGMNGQWAYFTDPRRVDLIDTIGLSDAFVARCPVKRGRRRPGHLVRAIPDEYIRIRRGETVGQWTDPALQELYERVRDVTAGPLFTSRRLQSMLWLWRRYGP
jgi:arabinofuranosyltransferase